MGNLRLGVAVLIAAATITTSTTGAEAASTLRFSKVQYDSPGDDTGSNTSVNAEWARITNYGTKSRVLTGWKIKDDLGHTYKFPTFTLKPGKSVRVHTGTGKNTATDLYWGEDYYVWNNTGDKAILKNKAGTTIDTCKWGDGSEPSWLRRRVVV